MQWQWQWTDGRMDGWGLLACLLAGSAAEDAEGDGLHSLSLCLRSCGGGLGSLSPLGMGMLLLLQPSLRSMHAP